MGLTESNGGPKFILESGPEARIFDTDMGPKFGIATARSGPIHLDTSESFLPYLFYYFQNHFTYVISIVLATLCLSNVLDFFLGLFYHSLIDGLVLNISLLQASVILTLGIQHILNHCGSGWCSNPGLFQATLQFIVVCILVSIFNLRCA